MDLSFVLLVHLYHLQQSPVSWLRTMPRQQEVLQQWLCPDISDLVLVLILLFLLAVVSALSLLLTVAWVVELWLQACYWLLSDQCVYVVLLS